MKNRGGFFKSNWAYIIWFIIYFSIAVLILSFFESNIWLCVLYSSALYGGSICLAISPLGEFLLRLTEGLNKVETREDNNYLLPIFDEVYNEAIEFSPSLNKDIKLYISETMTVNAFAIGRKTIAVTRGAINAFSRDELKGILSHEFGHIANGDTKSLLLNVVGNGFFSIIVLVLRFIMLFVQNFMVEFSKKNIVGIIFAFISFVSRLFVDISIFIFVFSGNLILALNSRYCEKLADEYAFHIGYGAELINALYLLNKITFPSKATIKEKLFASHPHTASRIEHLETLEEKSNQIHP